MCKEEKEYLEKWGRLQDATEELKKEIYGMRCRLEGIIACKENEKDTETWVEALGMFYSALGGIKIEIEEERFNFFMPEYFLGTEGGVIGTFDWNVNTVIEILNNIRNTIIANQKFYLVGLNYGCCEYGIVSSLVYAISDFEESFLNYIK